jgi:hypothetical protein
MPTLVGSVHVEILMQRCVLRTTGYWASSFPGLLGIPQLGGYSYAPLSLPIGGNESTLGHGAYYAY